MLCRMCGDEYTPVREGFGTYNQQYCSRGCATADMKGADYTPTQTPDMRYASCIGEPDARMFPPSGKISKELRRMCGGCLHQKECLEYALKVKVDGVWGGTSKQERKRMAAKMGIEQEPLVFHYLLPETHYRNEETSNA